MQLEIGKIYDGKVTGITNYGAFVEVPVEDGKPITGMVHISEVANTFVNDIREFLTEEQEVKVKVLQINEQGKISMSIKKAMPEEKPQQKQQQRPRRQERDRGVVWEPKPQKPQTEMTVAGAMFAMGKKTTEGITSRPLLNNRRCTPIIRLEQSMTRTLAGCSRTVFGVLRT